jgi:hypothetical protein
MEPDATGSEGIESENKEPENRESDQPTTTIPGPDQTQSPQPEPLSAQTLDSRIRAALESLVTSESSSAQRFSQELAILKRWYYRTHKVGEIFFANDRGELPMRRIARGATRVYHGEKEILSTPTKESEPTEINEPQ